MRKNPETSIEAYERIMASGTRETTYRKIIQALQTIGEGNYEAIALAANETESRIWKRIKETRDMGLIIDTGKRVLTKSGSNSMVYALFTDAHKYSHIPKPERVSKSQTSAVDYANMIIAKSKAAKKPASLYQPELF